MGSCSFDPLIILLLEGRVMEVGEGGGKGEVVKAEVKVDGEGKK